MSHARIVAALAFALAAAQGALAQTPPAACEKPEARPPRISSEQRIKNWMKDVNTWQECTKKNIADLQAKADVAVKAANAAVAEANAAVAAYNTTFTEIQAQIDAAR